MNKKIKNTLKSHVYENQKALKILNKHSPKYLKEDSMHSTQSLNDIKFREVKGIHDEIRKKGKQNFVAKKRFLNWDPVKIMQGEEFNPHEIISTTRKIQN